MQCWSVAITLTDLDKLNQRAHRRLLCHGEIENAKQPRVISPHPHKLEPRFAGESGETVRRVFVRIFRNDLFAGWKVELSDLRYERIWSCLGSNRHLDSAFCGIVELRAVPPLVKIANRCRARDWRASRIRLNSAVIGAVVVGGPRSHRLSFCRSTPINKTSGLSAQARQTSRGISLRRPA